MTFPLGNSSFVIYDMTIQDIRTQRLNQNEQFTLYDADGLPKIYTSLNLICDCGYHKWRVLH